MPASAPKTQTPKLPLSAALIVLAGLAVYSRILPYPFVFDDDASIAQNLSLRHLWRWPGAFAPPGLGATVQGRPVLNLSFALNYALGGTNPQGYHAANVLIHLLAGLALFGILRRTVAGRRGELFALAVALVWTVHPLQTESVTYVVQRAESLMGLFYLLTLYFFIRGVDTARLRSLDASYDAANFSAARRAPKNLEVCGHLGWCSLSVAACLFGMATKEVMVSAPVTILCYDRAFVAGSLREAGRRRWPYYLALAATWLPLAWLASHAGDRGGTSGVGSGVTVWRYGLTQFGAVAHYLRLVVWPHPLVFDYGARWADSVGEVLPPALLVIGLAAATLWALRRRPALGFLGLVFFALLAPTSLIPGNRQTMAEHRMYLPLAAVLIVLALAVERLARRAIFSPPRRQLLLGGTAAAVAAAVGILTLSRNQVYASSLALYGDTVEKRPDNPYAHSNYGYALGHAGRTAAAIAQFHEALSLKPDLADAHYNLGLILVRAGRIGDGIEEYEQALRARPAYPEALYNLGLVLVGRDRTHEAIELFTRLVALQPAFADGHVALGNALVQSGRILEGVRQLEDSLRLTSDSARGRYALGRILAGARMMPMALPQFEAAVRLDPSFPEAQLDLGNVLLALGRTREAIKHYEAALRLRPGYSEAQHDLDYARNLP